MRTVRTLLLTGFEPFLNYSSNPTQLIIEELEGRTIGDYTVASRLLPVDYAHSGEQLEQAITALDPDAVISLGLAAGRHKITPERIAVNANDGPVDNTGYTPHGEKIAEDGPDGIFSRLPLAVMVERLNRAQLPAEISNTAGLYLCNHVMYRGLDSLRRRGRNEAPCGFIHIPASYDLAIKHSQVPGWRQEDLTEAIRLCIETLSDPQADHRTPGGTAVAW